MSKENPFQRHNPLGLSEAATKRQEQLDIKVKIASPDDWQICKELRLLSIAGPEAKMFGATPKRVSAENNKTEQEWREETSSEDMFAVVAWNGSEAVGLGRTRKYEGVWRIRNGYVKPEFRSLGIQQKMLALRLSEIIKRGGTKVVTGIRTDNPVSLHNAEKFGFKKVHLMERVKSLGFSALKWHTLEIDLTNPEVIKKINEVLNEG